MNKKKYQKELDKKIAEERQKQLLLTEKVKKLEREKLDAEKN